MRGKLAPLTAIADAAALSAAAACELRAVTRPSSAPADKSDVSESVTPTREGSTELLFTPLTKIIPGKRDKCKIRLNEVDKQSTLTYRNKYSRALMTDPTLTSETLTPDFENFFTI